MVIIPARISDIRDATPTIKVISLDLLGQEFVFKPGQWIDCYSEIDGVREVAGYTITSSPSLEGFLELAIKVSDRPVTRFIHEKAVLGDFLYIDGGQGDVFYSGEMGDVVLIAAGIGITPVMSILRYVHDSTRNKALIIYGAHKPGELVFYEDIVRMVVDSHRIRSVFTVSLASPDWIGRVGRIDKALIESLKFDLSKLFYISGPREMIEDTIDILKELGVRDEMIRYEFWW